MTQLAKPRAKFQWGAVSRWNLRGLARRMPARIIHRALYDTTTSTVRPLFTQLKGIDARAGERSRHDYQFMDGEHAPFDKAQVGNGHYSAGGDALTSCLPTCVSHLVSPVARAESRCAIGASRPSAAC
jgi:hypothetical protein